MLFRALINSLRAEMASAAAARDQLETAKRTFLEQERLYSRDRAIKLAENDVFYGVPGRTENVRNS